MVWIWCFDASKSTKRRTTSANFTAGSLEIRTIISSGEILVLEWFKNVVPIRRMWQLFSNEELSLQQGCFHKFYDKHFFYISFLEMISEMRFWFFQFYNFSYFVHFSLWILGYDGCNKFQITNSEFSHS